MGWFTKVRDVVESVAVVGGNLFIPGSSILTSRLASKGSKKQLSSDIGMIAQIGSSVYTFAYGSPFASSPFAATPPPGAPVGDLAGGASLNPSAIPGSVDPMAAYTPAANSMAAPTAGMNAASAGGAVTHTGTSFADKALAIIDKHPMVAVMGASAVMQGIGAADASKQAEKDREIEQQRYNTRQANINAPTTLGFSPKPYQPVERTQGLISQYTPNTSAITNKARAV